jgi:hypothetical protein
MMATVLRDVSSQKAAGSRKALVVVGMHRSGTSAMTRTLSLLGAALPDGLMGPQPNNNETGFWEPASISILNDEILEALDSEWDDVFAFRPRPYLSNFDRFYVARAVELLEQEFHGAELIVLKDPRISVLSKFWERALREAGYATQYVVMVRNPLEVAESLRARDAFPREKSLLLWSSYLVAVERDSRDRARIFVSYDQLMNDWRSVQRRIEGAAGIPFPRDTAAAAIEIDRFLERRLRHHEAAAQELFARSDIPEHVKTLYRIFLEACHGAEVDQQAVNAVQSELGEIESLVGPLVVDLKVRAKKLANEVAELSDAQQAAREEIGTLGGQLEVERKALEERAAELKQSQDAAREQIDCLTAQITALNQSQELDREQIDSLKAQVAALDQSQEAARERIESLTAQLGAERKARGAQAVEAQKIHGELSLRQEEIEQVRSELSQALSGQDALRAEVSAGQQILEKERQDAEARLASWKERYERERSGAEELAATLEQADAEKHVVEARLKERFSEIATLSKMLAEGEGRDRRYREQMGWLREIAAVLASRPTSLKGRLLALLPASLQYRRQQKLLKRKALFDGEAYLATYPDVAREGVEPLRHYLMHGMNEDRRRG